MVQEMLSRDDRRRHSLSQHELERRWQAVRERMEAKGIDYLLIQSQQRYMGGYPRWFTDMPGANYLSTIVFPLDDDMTLIGSGAPSVTPAAGSPMLRGVKQTISVPTFTNVWWGEAWYAEKAAEVIMRKKPKTKTVGLVGLGNMAASLSENLRKGLPGVKIINATDLVDEVRMVKSEEELKLHRDAAYLHEMSYEVAKKAIKPGRNATDVVNEIRFAQILAGSEEQQISISFGSLGGPRYTSGNVGINRARRTFKEGDVVSMLLVESSALGGYWYDLTRILCIGSIPKGLQEAYDIVTESRAIMAANLKPGLLTGVALDASDKFLKSKGCPPEARVGGHGQGLDLLERPVIHRDEPAKLEVGMVLSLHPTAETKYAAARISDTYVITDAGAVPMYENLFKDDKIAVVG